MKKLTEALESFMMRYDEGEGAVSAAVVDNLNKAAVKYYDERQGAFIGPVTGKGQARLDIAIKVAEFTNQIIKPVNEEMNKAYEANQKIQKSVNANQLKK